MTQLRNTLVNTQEADALKDMIFKRARERAENLDNNLKNSYTTSTHNEIMDLARDSFVASKNPFTTIKEQKTEITSSNEVKKEEQIGFPPRKVKEIKENIVQKNNDASEKIANYQVEQAMLDARQDFSKKSSFMGALNFLNSQATISLISKRAKSFEALA